MNTIIVIIKGTIWLISTVIAVILVLLAFDFIQPRSPFDSLALIVLLVFLVWLEGKLLEKEC
jgi:hypothetical protein